MADPRVLGFPFSESRPVLFSPPTFHSVSFLLFHGSVRGLHHVSEIYLANVLGGGGSGKKGFKKEKVEEHWGLHIDSPL